MNARSIQAPAALITLIAITIGLPAATLANDAPAETASRGEMQDPIFNDRFEASSSPSSLPSATRG